MQAITLRGRAAGATLAAVLAAAPAGAESPIDHERLAIALVDSVVVPAYQDHATRTAALERAVAALCAAPGDAGLAAAQRAFHAAMDAWQAAAVFDLGPVSTGAGRARIQFWPDRRGTGARQLRRALATEDPSLLAPGALAEKSVALGDLQALERLLFDEPARLLEPASYRCALARAIAAHQAALASDLASAWTAPDGHRTAVVTAADGNDHYRDAREVALALFRSMVSMLESIVAQKLTRPLGDSLDEARPRRAESWRSERSAHNVVRNLDILIALFETPSSFHHSMRPPKPRQSL